LTGRQATIGSPSDARFVYSAEYRALSLRRTANRDAKGRLQICESVSPLLPTTILRRLHRTYRRGSQGQSGGTKMNDADDWVERLLADLRCASTTTWEGGKEALPRNAEHHRARNQMALGQARYQAVPIVLRSGNFPFRARLVEQSDPYAETLRQASAGFNTTAMSRTRSSVSV
jgi:hypothetical protein